LRAPLKSPQPCQNKPDQACLTRPYGEPPCTHPAFKDADIDNIRSTIRDARLSGDDVLLDDVEQMVIALQRAGVLSRVQAVRLQARYLRENKP
jgi:hypothetical protein